MRVLHGPVNIGNQPWALSRQERRLGVRSDVVVAYDTWLNYRADRCLGACGRKTREEVFRRSWFGLTAPLRYDVLHYYFGRSFMSWEDFLEPWPRGRYLDVKLARRLGRKVFMTLQGCDVRLSDRSAARNAVTMCHEGHCGAVPTCRGTLDARRRDMITDVLPLCHRVFVLNPELAHFVPGAVFLPYACVDVEATEPAWPATEGPITILHAPTDEGIKGSRFITEAVERLQKRWPIELLLVRGLPHAEAVPLYRRADFVIDQVLAGWYGAFAVEAMALGKPVGCYLRPADLEHVPPAMRAELPLLRLRPHTLEDDLEALLRRRRDWPAWGRRARAFVLRWHNPRRIAAAMIRAYRDPACHFDLAQEVTACAA
jgi:hypothetical protein